MDTLQKERDYLASLNLREERKYNVISLRNGDKVIWNKTPLLEKDAIELTKKLKRAKIPSVDWDSIKVIKIGENKAVSKDTFVDKRMQEIRKNAEQILKEVDIIKAESDELDKYLNRYEDITQVEDILYSLNDLIKDAVKRIENKLVEVKKLKKKSKS